ncbi:hypothetical protein ABW19_dt0208803 [Dactylella cylindrospora]|nr:hypothetical protein ABW19_dt0208803 [Dactylella cylindrospora]
MSKTTYNPLCPTLVVNIQLEQTVFQGKRRASDSPTASSAQLYEPDDSKLTLFFRSGPKDIPPLTIWCREIQSYIRSTQSRRSSTVTFGGDRAIARQSFRSVAYDLKIAEDEWEEERASNPHLAQTTRSSEESSSRSSDAGPTRPISTLTMHEFGNRPSASMNQSPVDPHDMSPSLSTDYMACASLSSSPRRETILDRAFSMNYIPSSPTGSSHYLVTPPLTSVARFEAVANDPSLSRTYNHKDLELDPSIMPASFFQYK